MGEIHPMEERHPMEEKHSMEEMHSMEERHSMKEKIRRIPLGERLRRAGNGRSGGPGCGLLRKMMDSPVSAYLGSARETERLCRLRPEPPKENGRLSYRDVAAQVCRMWGSLRRGWKDAT